MGVSGAPMLLGHDLAELDEVARQSSGVDPDGRILALVEHAAGLPDGLHALVTRFATAPNPLLPRAVSFVLAQPATDPTGVTWTSTRDFAGRAGGGDDPATSINVLTAVRRHLEADVLPPGAWADPRLTEFVLHCLGQPPIVQSVAIDLLVSVAADGAFGSVPSPAVVDRFRRVLADLGETGEIDDGDAIDILTETALATVRERDGHE